MAKPASESIQHIPLTEIRTSLHQARKHFNEEALKALADSMQHEGLIQPVTVRPLGIPSTTRRDTTAAFGDPTYNIPPPPEAFELISGERRFRAAKLLGWETIPSRVIHVISEGEAAAKGLVENLQREDLNPIEEAEGFAQLNKVDPVYWTQERISHIVGKDRTYIGRSVALLSLPEVIQEHVRARTLSRSHALELMRLPTPEKQEEVTQQVVNQKLNWEATRRLVDSLAPKRLKQKSSDLAKKSAEIAKKIALEEGLGQPDPLSETWKRLGSLAPSFNHMKWVADYDGNWHWRFDLDLSKFWAMTQDPVSITTPESQAKQLAELRKTLGEWFDKMVQEIGHPVKANRGVLSNTPITGIPAPYFIGSDWRPDGQVYLNWSEVPGASGYQLLYTFDRAKDPLYEVPGMGFVHQPNAAVPLETSDRRKVWFSVKAMTAQGDSPPSDPIEVIRNW